MERSVFPMAEPPVEAPDEAEDVDDESLQIL